MQTDIQGVIQLANKLNAQGLAAGKALIGIQTPTAHKLLAQQLSLAGEGDSGPREVARAAARSQGRQRIPERPGGGLAVKARRRCSPPPAMSAVLEKGIEAVNAKVKAPAKRVA